MRVSRDPKDSFDQRVSRGPKDSCYMRVSRDPKDSFDQGVSRDPKDSSYMRVSRDPKDSFYMRVSRDPKESSSSDKRNSGNPLASLYMKDYIVHKDIVNSSGIGCTPSRRGRPLAGDVLLPAYSRNRKMSLRTTTMSSTIV
jgi:hypothetical protein